MATVRAASVDPELQPLLERGLLAREVEGSGFSLDPGLVAPRAAEEAPPGRSATRRERRVNEAAKARLRKAKERLAAAQGGPAAQKELGRAEREAQRAAEAVAKAEQAVESAQEEL